MMSDDELYSDVIESCFGFSIDGIWEDLLYNHTYLMYKDRIEKFIFIIEKAMENGILKLAKDGVFLKGSIKDQVELFKKSFPKEESKISDIMFCLDSDNNFWTPGGGVWIRKDGTEILT